MTVLFNFCQLLKIENANRHDKDNILSYVHIFEIPDPNLPIHFVTFRVLRRRLSHRRKIAFSHYEGYKVYCFMRSITWPVHRRSLKTTRNNFLTPNCLFTIQLLWDYDDYWGWFILEHPHVKAFSDAKTVQSKSVPKMAVFRKFKGLNIKCSYRDPQKAFPCTERRLMTYFA